ncbi:MAG: hypothetical protein QM791_23780 [Ferruginibacter sp.]
MKKSLLSWLLLLIAANSFSQNIKISQLPTAVGKAEGGYVPVVVGAITKKVRTDSIAQQAIDHSDSVSASRIQSLSGFNVDNTDPFNPWILATQVDGTTITGSGISGDPFKSSPGYKKYTVRFYQTSTSDPQVAHSFPGGGLPSGVTVSFVRTGTGVYEVRVIYDTNIITVDEDDVFIQLTGFGPYKITSVSSSTVSTTGTLKYEFTVYNTSGVATDGIYRGYLELRFY